MDRAHCNRCQHLEETTPVAGNIKVRILLHRLSSMQSVNTSIVVHKKRLYMRSLS